MKEWALFKGTSIVDVVTSSRSRSELQKDYPGFRVVALDSVPSAVAQRYRYWDERP